MSERLRVNEKLVEPRIAGAPDDTRAQLFEFGELMIGEVLARTASLDSKAQNVIGWTSALLALLLAGAASEDPAAEVEGWRLVSLTLGAISAVVGLGAGAVALWIRGVRWPSQQDWLRGDLFETPGLLRAYHLLALLGTHEAHSGINERKARAVAVAQISLVIAGACVGLVLIVPAIGRWLR